MKNDKQINPPLIDRILIIGINESEFQEVLSTKTNDTNLSNITVKILEDYRSNHLKDSINDNYIENIISVNYN
jgi:hypothetical protein